MPTPLHYIIHMTKSQDKPLSTSIKNAIPLHIGFIADGNRRWAKSHNLPGFEGHRQGAKRVEEIAEAAFKNGVKYVSFFIFSNENWKRSKAEVSFLMTLVRLNLTRLAKKCQKNDIRVVFMGREKPAPANLIKKFQQIEEETKNNQSGTICICFNYGGQWEIADATTKIIADINNGKLSKETAITPEIFAKYLYHPEVPPCDLIVRTSGEIRISGYQLWRASYSEFLFLDKNFPDLTAKDVPIIIEKYQKRKRNFGK